MTEHDRRAASIDRRRLLRRDGGRRVDDPAEPLDALLARADADIAIATRLLDVSVIARRMQVTGQTVRNWIARDLVDAVRTPGGFYKVPVSELARLLKSQSNQTPQL